MNSKVLDESIAESLQTLDLMCFSEQYYFLVALISFGMLLVTTCAEIKVLRRDACSMAWRLTNPPGGPGRPPRSVAVGRRGPNGLKFDKETTHRLLSRRRVASMA